VTLQEIGHMCEEELNKLLVKKDLVGKYCLVESDRIFTMSAKLPTDAKGIYFTPIANERRF